jgi:uncharacterized membrane protein YdfJ with MMPL/SSD domain
MFAKLARFANRFRVIMALLWFAGAAISFLAAPSLSDVGVTDESQFLPQDTESAYARTLLKEKFATESDAAASSGLIVIYRKSGLTEGDMAGAKATRDWLVSTAAPSQVESVTSVFDSEALRSTLVSADNTTMLMVVDFSVSSLDEGAKKALTEIRQYLRNYHPDLTVYVSGEVGLYNDLFDSILQTIDRTTLVTIILVLVLLLIIYRSPVAALLPLLSIGCSFLVARGLVGALAASGVQISTLADAYLVVIIFGVGTDYCLFIVSRFREELLRHSRDEAQHRSLTRIGPVIVASAVTVIVAFLSLGISRFGMNRTTGYALAIGVAVNLVAGLTLVPALMSLFGRKVFWPSQITPKPRGSGFGWSHIGQWVTRYPIIIAVIIIAIMFLPYASLGHLTRSADVISQMPKSAESAKGYNILSDHFAMGEFSPLYLLIESPTSNITDAASLEAVKDVAVSLGNVPGVSRVDYYSAPSTSLAALTTQVHSIGNGLSRGLPDTGQLAGLQTSGQYLTQLAVRYPSVTKSDNFKQASLLLQTAAATAGRLQSTPTSDMPALLTQLRQHLYGLADSLDGLSQEFLLEKDTAFTNALRATYFATDGSTARINIVLSDDAYSIQAQETVTRLRDEAKKSLATTSLSGGHTSIGGEAATRADIMSTNDADFGRVAGLVSAGILVVIIILLRSLIAPLYMVLTVLFNYGTTIGIASWLFLDVLKQGSIIYMIPIFVLVVLVALGADYNIFLISRIREEAQQQPVKEAVQHAVTHTGGVITACGIILAGTFATLTTAPLQVVFQIGAAIAIGILFDTFVVRALLVPCLATIAGRWSWWPSRLSRHTDPKELSPNHEG